MVRPSTVVLVDDEEEARARYHRFFAGQPGYQVVGEASDGAEAVRLWRATQPRLTLMDLNMPRMAGIEAISRITKLDAHACVVALTATTTDETVVSSLKAGAAGYLLKGLDAQELSQSLDDALVGLMPLAPTIRPAVVRALRTQAPATTPLPSTEIKLTRRESEVAKCLVRGLSNADIAAELFIAEATVKQHFTHLADKLGARSRTRILLEIQRLGLLADTDEPR